MAAKLKTSITIRPEVLEQAGVLSANETHRYSISSLIEELIQDAYTRRADTFKRIEPRRDGKKTIGFDMYYGDFHVGYIDGVASRPQAEIQLNSWVMEELSK